METTMQLTNEQLALGGAAIGGFIGVILGIIATIAIVVWIFQIIAFWKIFTKAGEPGWKSIIPIYGSYVCFKISWKPMWFWVFFVLTFVYSFLSSFSGASGGTSALDIISTIAAIALLIVQIAANYKLSTAFGHGVGFAVGLTLLWPIFVLILGYGKSEYVGADL